MDLISRTTFSDDERRRVYNRIAWKFLPLLLLGYTLANIDRVNIAFAKLQMGKAIGLTDAMYGFGAGIFFISYAIVEIPSNMILYRVGARAWLSRIMIVWGVISTATMFVHTPTEFYVVRVVLGVAEAGFYPGALFFISCWFPSQIRAQATSIMLLGSSLASIIGNPLSGAAMEYLNGLGGLAGWQWLFVVEGAPAALLGLAALSVLRNGPRDAPWLDPGEREMVANDLAADDNARGGGRSSRTFAEAFRSPDIWWIVLANFCNLSTLYGIQFWLPTVIQKTAGTSLIMTGIIASAMSVIPCVVLIANARHSDRARERRWHAVTGFALSVVGLSLAGTFSTAIVLVIGGLLFAQCGFVIASSTIFSLPGTFVSGAAAAAGFSLITTVGSLVGYATPFAFGVLHQATGSFRTGFYVMALLGVIGAAAILAAPALRRPKVGRAIKPRI